jgi:hypothetical protein
MPHSGLTCWCSSGCLALPAALSCCILLLLCRLRCIICLVLVGCRSIISLPLALLTQLLNSLAGHAVAAARAVSDVLQGVLIAQLEAAACA